jgi:hypothetical protein
MKYELGTFSVQGRKYTTLIDAVLDAQKTLSNINWDFFSEDFKKVDWLVEPNLSLDELYRLRAQQIRDAYDYIIVMVSGGADSTNVIKTFLNNNIHVDEVFCSAPLSGLNNWNWNDTDTSTYNTISETKYALIPLLNEIKSSRPNLKVTLHDSFQELVNTKSDEWLYKDSVSFIHPVTNARTKLTSYKRLNDLAEQGKKIGIIWGVDKPILKYDKFGNLFNMISNPTFDSFASSFEIDYPNVDRVLFYHTKDLPEVLVKMSHAAAKFLHKKENLHMTNTLGRNVPLWEFEKPFGKKMKVDIDAQREMCPAIYPSTYKKVFQCKKFVNVGVESFVIPQHQWFENLHKDTKIYQMYKSDFNLFYKNIHPKYLTKDGRSFIKFQQFYKIGHYTIFLS